MAVKSAIHSSLVLLSLCVAGVASAQNGPVLSQEPLPVDVVLSTRSLVREAPSLAPDGRWLAYTLPAPHRNVAGVATSRLFTDQGVPEFIAGNSVWITDTKSGESKSLTDSTTTSWGPVWSPDGKYLAFYSDQKGKANLWIYERDSSRVRPASDAIVRPFDRSEVVRWTPDSKRVLTKLLAEGNTLQQSAEGITPPSAHNQGAPAQAGSTVMVYRSSEKQEKTDAPVADTPEIQEDRFTKAENADLAFVDVESGAVQRIARGFNPMWYGISPDGSQVAFTTKKGLRGGNVNRTVFDLVIVASDGAVKVVGPDILSGSFAVSWSPDGKWLSYATSVQAGAGGLQGECYLLRVEAGRPRRATPKPHADFSQFYGRAPLWDRDGQYIYLLDWNLQIQGPDAVWRISVSNGDVVRLASIPNHKITGVVVSPRTDGRFWSPDGGRSMAVSTLDVETKQSGFYRIGLSSGKATKLFEENKVYGPYNNLFPVASDDGKNILYQAEDAANPSNLWVLGPDLQNPRRVTNLNPQFDRYLMGSSRLIEWRSLDGEPLRGALLLPAGYQPGKRYPMVVWLYGGLNESDFVNYFGLWPWDPLDNMQLLATRGYAVLFPDSRANLGTPMSDLAKTVLPGVNKAIELGIADPERLGVMGESYGGYSTLSLIVQTARFKAAISRAGPGDFVGLYGEMDKAGGTFGLGLLETTHGFMGGTPWEFRQRYIENSPVFYLDRVQTPLLIVHGTMDTAVAPFLGDEVFVDLRRLGKEVVYAKYEGEGHGITAYANQLDYCNRMIQWFDQHLKNAERAKKQQPSN